MKKIIAIASLLASTLAIADNVSMDVGRVTVPNSQSQHQTKLGVKHEFSDTLAGDVAIIQTQIDNTYTLGTRVEAGLITSKNFGNFAGYTRFAFGEKYSNTSSFSYYVVEPGVTTQVGPFALKAGYRFRSPVSVAANTDQTHTARFGISYPLDKSNSVGLLYDRVRGDVTQNIVAATYTHGF